MISCSDVREANPGRRKLIERAAWGAGLSMLSPALMAQTVAADAPVSPAVTKLVEDFAKGAKLQSEGLKLDLPVLGDNPASVPVKVSVTLPISERSYCEELIVIAESNPQPLASTFHFTPYMSTAEAAIRLRLIASQNIRALARMSDGKVLTARQFIEVAPGSCGL